MTDDSMVLPTRQRSLSSAMAWSGLASAIDYLSSILGNILIARALYPEDLGRLVYLTWLLSSAGMLGSLSVPYATGIHLSGYFAQGRHASARCVYKNGLELVALSTIILLTGFAAFRASIVPVAWNSGWVIALGMLLVGGHQLRSILIVWPSAQMDYRLVGRSNNWGSVAWLLAATAAYVLRSPVLGLAAYVAKQILPLLPLAFPAWRAMSGDLPDNRAGIERSPRSFWPLALEHWITLIGVTIVWSRFEVGMLKWMGTDSDVALYAIAAQLAGPVAMATTLFTAPVALYTTRELAAGRAEHLVKTVSCIIRLFGLFSGLVGIGVAAVSPIVLPFVFGARYAPSAQVVAPLSLAGCLYALISVLSAISHGIERPRLSLLSMLVSAPVFLGLAYWLIPITGAWGAALAKMGGQLVSLLVLRYSIVRHVPGTFSLSDMAKLGVSVALPMVLLLIATPLLAPWSVIGVGLPLVVYALAMCRWLGLLKGETQSLKPLLVRLPGYARVIAAKTAAVLTGN